MLELIPLILGPLETNACLLADPATGECAVIDPAWDAAHIAAEASRRGWCIRQIWITHAHYDHMAAAADLVQALEQPPLIALHPADRRLWDSNSGSTHFGCTLPPSPEPALALSDGVALHLGKLNLEVRHTPGHTPGHCIFYCQEMGVCFCGDLIFRGSVGRTDLPGGDWDALLASIRTQVFTLPDRTRLLPGHGPETTVKHEKRHNPFIRP